MKKTLFLNFLYRARDICSRDLFAALRMYCRGQVLDVGGWDFWKRAVAKDVRFDTWTVLEKQEKSVLNSKADERIRMVAGDGCKMDFPDAQFDAVVNVQVLEHVMEPIRMVAEMCRVLKTDGYLIMLVPQTGSLHLAPFHYYNFTRYWIEKVLEQSEMEILELRPLGGFWSSMASHLLYFFFHSFRVEGMSDKEISRNTWFYLLYPFMAVFAVVALPICLFFSLGDLEEEPNNHLVVAIKKLNQE